MDGEYPERKSEQQRGEQRRDPGDTRKAADALTSVADAFAVANEMKEEPAPVEASEPAPPAEIVDEAFSPPGASVEPEHDPDETAKIETPAYLLKPIADMLPTIGPVYEEAAETIAKEMPVEPPPAKPKKPRDKKKPAKKRATKRAMKRPTKRTDNAHKKPVKKKAKKTVAKRTTEKRKMKK